MSQEHVESSRRLWDRFMAGDTPGVLACVDTDVEVHDVPELPGASVYYGHAGWLEQIAKFREAFEQIDYRVLEHIDCRESVVTVIEATATGTGSGITGTMTTRRWRPGAMARSCRFGTSRASRRPSKPPGCGSNQIGVVDLVLLDGVAEGAHHVLLPHHLVEGAGCG
ncbi:MAG: nuclear transport factor 2 family protein [Actinomycetota bacterium]